MLNRLTFDFFEIRSSCVYIYIFIHTVSILLARFRFFQKGQTGKKKRREKVCVQCWKMGGRWIFSSAAPLLMIASVVDWSSSKQRRWLMTDMSHLDPASNVKVLGEGRRDWSILVRGVQQHSDSKKNKSPPVRPKSSTSTPQLHFLQFSFPSMNPLIMHNYCTFQ